MFVRLKEKTANNSRTSQKNEKSNTQCTGIAEFSIYLRGIGIDPFFLLNHPSFELSDQYLQFP